MTAFLPKISPMLLVTLGTALFLAACATEPPGDANTVATTGDQALECREELRTGTNFKRRVCLTTGEWEARGRGQRRGVEDLSRQTSESAAVGAGANAAVPNGPPTATFP